MEFCQSEKVGTLLLNCYLNCRKGGFTSWPCGKVGFLLKIKHISLQILIKKAPISNHFRNDKNYQKKPDTVSVQKREL